MSILLLLLQHSPSLLLLLFVGLWSSMAMFFISGVALRAPPGAAAAAGAHHGHNQLDLHPTLSYHSGPLLCSPTPIRLYFIFCGTFTPNQISILLDFAASFSGPSASVAQEPSVATWWKTATLYRDERGEAVSAEVVVAANATVEAPAEGSQLLRRSDIGRIVEKVVAEKGELPADEGGLYVVFTGENVGVEGFCMSDCGFHDVLMIKKKMDGVQQQQQQLAFAWVGNPAVQCPGFCAWPFAGEVYGPPAIILRPPNGDAGVDGMIISLATVLAGAATNPRNSGFYEGDPAAPLEAVSACAGMYGRGGLPGQLGELLEDGKSGARYNANGANGRKFLLPAMWSPASERCETLPPPPPPTRRPAGRHH